VRNRPGYLAVYHTIGLCAVRTQLFGQTGARALPRGRRRIGQSIETPAIYPTMTAVQNLEIQRILAGVPDQGAVQEMPKLVGLADTGKKRAKHFPLGMKQRLALAIALITNPEFLIDERMTTLIFAEWYKLPDYSLEPVLLV
jgi:ABC-type multidrug transport system ATPase subunit